jgi:hypothetical protein
MSGDSPPQLLLGPEVSVAEQEESLQEKARVDDGGEFSAIEIVYSNGRPTRRVDFTPASVKEAAAAAAAEKADAEAAAAAAAKAARRAELEAELAALNASDPADGTEDEGLRLAAAITPGASASLPEVDLDANDDAGGTDSDHATLGKPGAVAPAGPTGMSAGGADKGTSAAPKTAQAEPDPAPTVSPEAAALEADDEAAATDDQTVADPAPVSGKRKR